MKYRLKKDLPFAGAGNPLLYSVNDNSYIMVENACSGGLTNIGHYQDLLEAGWIEEVKPREFYIMMSKDSSYPVFAYSEKPHSTSGSLDSVSFIKVREVLE